ncbi:hypothetical protein CSUI_008171 [Cystoisospora suis]|uniref:Transmembrane protein n=1 Tax=Cystoisospora suis TaxID=483139 RepID=A0A2C6KNF2_9APIC|nr:hypothetical protein CSUI_008171 [Cystoisospora suis]
MKESEKLHKQKKKESFHACLHECVYLFSLLIPFELRKNRLLILSGIAITGAPTFTGHSFSVVSSLSISLFISRENRC